MLCDQVVFEQGTQKPYLLGVFTGLGVDGFPTAPQRIDVFAALTDGLGDVRMTLKVVHLDTDEEVYTHGMIVRFPDPLSIVNLRLRVRRLAFVMPGIYLFALTAGDHEVAARRLHVYEAGE
jgi:hypothetical protein